MPVTVEPGVGIAGRSMGVVGAPLAMEVRFGIAPAALRRRLAGAVLRFDALHRGPGLDQRAIDREVIAGQKPLHPGLRPPRGTWPRWHLPAAGRGSSRTSNGPRLRRRRRFRRTCGTAGRNPAAPSEAAPSGSNKTPATASTAAASQAGSTAARSANTARQTRAPAPTAPRSRSSGSRAADELYLQFAAARPCHWPVDATSNALKDAESVHISQNAFNCWRLLTFFGRQRNFILTSIE
ncbi:hypothetical protein ABIF97_004189 [Bradyrhizobium japonicum]